jgi:Tfp pilus assembly protein PilO
MNSDRLWVFAAVAAMVLIAVGGWFVGVSPIVAQGAAADAQTASIVQDNAANQAKVAVLKTQFSHIGKLQKKLNTLRQSIPEGAEASAFLDELNSLSAKYGVTLVSLTIASATVYQSPTSTAPAAGTTSGTSTASPTPTPSPSAATTPANPTATPSGQFVEVPVQIEASGAIDRVRNFIGAVQSGARLYLASNVTIAASTASSGYTGSMTGYIFTLQGTSDEPTTTTPSSTPTPTPTAIPTPTGTATTTPPPSGTPTPGATSTTSP